MDFGTLARQVGRDDPCGDPDPYPTLSWLRSTGPIAEVPGPGGGPPIWFVTSYELARQCLTDPRLSFDPRNAAVAQHSPGHLPYVLAKDPPEHSRLRGLVGQVFSPGAMQRLRPVVAHICRVVLDRLSDRAEVDLLSDYAIPIPEAVTYALFGIPPSQELAPGRATELSIITALTEQYAGGPASAELHLYIDRIIDSGCYAGSENLTSTLVEAMNRGEADRATVAGMLYLLFSTGQLSTAPFIASALVQLLQQPASVKGLLAQPRQWRAAVNEALRHSSAVQTSMPRFALEELELGGQRVGKGETVLISIAGANHDSAHFAQPGEFQPDRRSQTHLAFGFGPHFCIGAPLARLESEIALEGFFRRFAGSKLLSPAQDLAWVLGPMLRCPKTVPVLLG